MAQGIIYKNGVYYTSPQATVINVSEEKYKENQEYYDSLPCIVNVDDGKVANASDIKYGNGSVADALDCRSTVDVLYEYNPTTSSFNVVNGNMQKSIDEYKYVMVEATVDSNHRMTKILPVSAIVHETNGFAYIMSDVALGSDFANTYSVYMLFGFPSNTLFRVYEGKVHKWNKVTSVRVLGIK